MRFFFLSFICLFALGFNCQAQSDTITLKSGLRYVVVTEGKGWGVSSGEKVLVHYTGKLTNGKVFDTSENGKPIKFRAGTGQVIKGWDKMLLLMRTGQEVDVIIPAELAYGARGVRNPETENYLIPPGSDLHFRIKLIKVLK